MNPRNQPEYSGPRIVYLSWPPTEITGGIKIVYRHVELLREAGFAAVVATLQAVAPEWFPSTVPTIALNDLRKGEDILVFPENNLRMFQALASWKNPKIVFCQNQFQVYRGSPGLRDWMDQGVTEIITGGVYPADFCRRRYPDLPVTIVPYYIDAERFRPAPKKKFQIASIPRKRPQELEIIRDLFRAENPQWADLPWVEISGRTEAEVARLLGESAVHLSLCRMESFGLTLLEGLASGCVSAGFTGHGGREFADDTNGLWADEDDCPGCATLLAEAVRIAEGGGEACQSLTTAGLETARRYSPERFRTALIEFWDQRFPVARDSQS